MTRALTAALVLAVALPASADGPDGGLPPLPEISYDCPGATSPPAARVDGGYFITDERERRVTCLFEATKNHRDQLRRQVDEDDAAESRAIVVIAGIVVVAIGSAYVAGRLSK